MVQPAPSGLKFGWSLCAGTWPKHPKASILGFPSSRVRFKKIRRSVCTFEILTSSEMRSEMCSEMHGFRRRAELRLSHPREAQGGEHKMSMGNLSRVVVSSRQQLCHAQARPKRTGETASQLWDDGCRPQTKVMVPKRIYGKLGFTSVSQKLTICSEAVLERLGEA